MSELYGLYVLSHHSWSRLLVVMARAGTGVVLAAARADPGVQVTHEAGHLPRLNEKRPGALDAFIARHDIEILDNKAWNAKKAELGDAVYRERG